MRNLLFVAMLIAVPGASFAESGGIPLARQFANELRILAQESRLEASLSGARPEYSQILRNAAAQAYDMSLIVRDRLVPAIRSDRVLAAKRVKNLLQDDMSNLSYTLQRISWLPRDIRAQFHRVQLGWSDVQAYVSRMGQGSGWGRVAATCRVVRETLFGSDIRDYIGRGRAFSLHQALVEARNDGMRRCRADLVRAQKCTVAIECEAQLR